MPVLSIYENVTVVHPVSEPTAAVVAPDHPLARRHEREVDFTNPFEATRYETWHPC